MGKEKGSVVEGKEKERRRRRKRLGRREGKWGAGGGGETKGIFFRKCRTTGRMKILSFRKRKL